MFDAGRSIPPEFTKAIPADAKPACRLLVVDAASDIGGTWAQDRLYPNLLSQNSYGLYEFSDMSLAETIPAEEGESDQQFIPGWKINRYLHAWADKWDLKKHIRLNWEVCIFGRRRFCLLLTLDRSFQSAAFRLGNGSSAFASPTQWNQKYSATNSS